MKSATVTASISTRHRVHSGESALDLTMSFLRFLLLFVLLLLLLLLLVLLLLHVVVVVVV